MSPIQFGIPQTRLRMYILAVKKKNKNDHPMIKWPKVKENINDLRQPKTNLAKYFIKKPKRPRLLSADKKKILRLWEDFLKRIPKKVNLVSPMWIAEFGATYPYENETPRKIGYEIAIL